LEGALRSNPPILSSSQLILCDFRKNKTNSSHIPSAGTACSGTNFFVRKNRNARTRRRHHVRFTPESGHVQRTRLCPLWAISGHCTIRSPRQRARAKAVEFGGRASWQS